MYFFPLLCLLTLSLVQEGTSTHLETCECHEIRDLVNASVQQAAPPGETADDPAISCKDLYDTYDASSGYYWIGEVGSAVRVYCNMSLTCGDVTGGWMRVANIDMTNSSQNCPSGLTLITSPKRVCDITSTAWMCEH